jgi:hypothetical protein
VKFICDFVAKQRDDYRSETVEITDGYEFSQYQTLRTIELYDNDRFETGNTDSLDEKSRSTTSAPFSRTWRPVQRTWTPRPCRYRATASPLLIV